MSNEIRQDINYDKVKQEIKEMSLDLINCKNNTGPLVTKDILISKYQHTYNKTPYLFDMVFKEYGSPSCMNKLNMMLDKIINVKEGNKTRHDASVEVGEVLAQEYVFPKVNN
jgi:hypothetical protein